ncbi:MAG: YHS domain-containing protein [Candidatus Poribacteria bacterium]
MFTSFTDAFGLRFNRARDPVCGMKIKKKEAAATTNYAGKRYYFCAVSCQTAFLKNPAGYAKHKIKIDKRVNSSSSCCHH